MRKILAVLAVLAIVASPAFAVQNRNLEENQRTPPNAPDIDGDFCSDPNAFIGGGNTVVVDAGSPPVEDVCNWPGPPGIGGNPGSAPDALAVFNGASLDGDWTMTLTDAYEPFSDGTFERWCLTNNFDAPGEGEGTPQTPATSTWGVIAMIVLFLGVSLFFLRRRATA